MDYETAEIEARSSDILNRIGTQVEREELLRVMSGQLGIPADEFKSNDSVIPVLASAASKYMNYAWVPGIHMHAISFNTKDRDGKYRQVYTLIDGEKAWRDTAERYRHEYGVQWFEQFKPMITEDVERIARQQGMMIDMENPPAGVWCRVIRSDKALAAKGLEGTEFEYNPEWESGIWTGKILLANGRTRNDSLPTGRTPEQTARRRALKAAIMAQFTPIPLDNRGERERMQYMVEELRSELGHENKFSMPVVRKPDLVEEGSGLLLATR